MIALKSMSGDRCSIAVGSCFETDEAEAKRLMKSLAAKPAKGTEKAIVNVSQRESRVKRVVKKVAKVVKKVTKKAAKKSKKK